MSELTLEEKLRTAHVTRWQIVNVGRSQSVAEHSFLVQIIAIEISRKVKYSNHRAGPINIEKEHAIMRWAMWHDMMEVKTGDINTPVKMKMKKLAGDEWMQAIEYDLSAEFEVVSKDTGRTVKDLVKLADFMEALNFLVEEGKGKHSDEVCAKLRGQMLEYFEKAKNNHRSLEWDNIKPLLLAL